MRLRKVELPAELNSFLGRRDELAEIRRLLSRARLVTLTGVGGVGKTRLALRAAAKVGRSFADGAVLVELAGMPDPLLLPRAVSTALGIADRTARAELEVVADFLATRQVLLVIDGCEHMLPAVARLLVELLPAAPALRILATSREALQIYAEHLYVVNPLPVPEPGDRLPAAAAVRYPGVALFADRARAVRPEFVVTDANATLVTEVCRRLDGIPLAIELAAVRLRSLSLDQIAERLNDRFGLLTDGDRAGPPRHQTLRAAIGWSRELCTPQEQTLWTRAAVFSDSFDLEAAERVCAGNGLPTAQVLDVLASLVGKSVVVAVDHAGRRRYRLLDTVRQFGLDRLRDPADPLYAAGCDEAALRCRHRDFYLDLAERFHAEWIGPNQLAWSGRMRAELPNLRGALGYCLSSAQQARTGVRLAGALHYLWYACGEAREGRLWLGRVLAADPAPSRERVRALASRARLMLLGEPAAAETLAHDVLELARRFAEPGYVTEALTMLGIGHLYHNNPTAGMQLLTEAAARAADPDPAHPQVAYANVPLALALLLRDDPHRAGELLAESRAICRAHGDQWYLGLVLFNSALQALALSDVAQAAAYARECLRLRHDIHDVYGAAAGLEMLAWVAAIGQDHLRATRLLGAAAQQWRSIGGSTLTGPLVRRDENAAAARAALGDSVFDAEFTRGGDLGVDDAIAYALGHQPSRTDPHAHHADETPRLTGRQDQIAELVARGMSNKQIAARLLISQRTVESHVENTLSKLGFTSRTQIAAWYTREHGPSE